MQLTCALFPGNSKNLIQRILIAPEHVGPTVYELLTAIQGMNDAGYKIRHIMLMSRHKSETFVKSYNRECSIIHKKKQNNYERQTNPSCRFYVHFWIEGPGSRPVCWSLAISCSQFCHPIVVFPINPQAFFQQNSTFNSCVFNLTVTWCW